MRNKIRLKLGSKIFILSFISISSVVLLLGYISQNFVKGYLLQQQASYIQRLIEQRDLYLNQYMTNLRGDLLALSRDERLYDSKTYASAYLANFRSFWNADVKNLEIVYPDGSIGGTSDFLAELYQIHHIRSILEKDALDLSFPFYWTEPYVSPISGYTVSVITHYRSPDGTYRGSLMADLDLNAIFAKYGDWNFLSEKDLLILSAQNRPISTSHPYVNYDVFNKNYVVSGLSTEKLDAIRSKSVTMTDESGKQLIVNKSESNSWGWKVVVVLDRDKVEEAIGIIRTYSTIVFILGVIISLVLSFYLSRYIVKPINLLIEQMYKVSRGDFQTQIALSYRNEIGYLVRHFNRMVRRIKGLMDNIRQIEHTKKQYELKVLQSQIHPHFLYNTLNAVRYMAKNDKPEMVDVMVTSLIELLKFHLDQVAEMVPLVRELDGIRHYAVIMSERYPDTFELEIEAADETLAVPVPKLTLQPLVENSIFHGIIPKGCGTVVVSAFVEEEQLVLRVSDDGVGMSQATLSSLFERSDTKASVNNYYSLGVGSIRERLQLYYGDHAFVRINSSPDWGTEIEIRLPIGGIPSDDK
ncbi:sensor histidine kinase [Paenibacillus oryzisoli]|uniref:cache domain-containing sensor histidine kinase n=1 Tax=Paenibacillus oryzisoli TaxID=1850517 RepID=UPI003D280DE7